MRAVKCPNRSQTLKRRSYEKVYLLQLLTYT
nr:MAG TPA: hypothetical protein [Caudoviricetes sp.]